MGTAIYSGVTGLLAHQRRMDVVGNNIANTSTTGFRSSRILFEDLFSQTLQGGTAPSGTNGGSNPKQIGLGVGVGSVDVDYTGGSVQTTGVSSDLAIEGNGFFVLSNGSGKYYTRDGSFGLNSAGTLYDPSTGMHVIGYAADANGKIDTNTAPGDLTIPIGNISIVRATQNAYLAGNLNSGSAVGDTVVRTLQVYDSLGTARDVKVTFTRNATVTANGTNYNAWTYKAEYNGVDVGTVPTGETGVLLFDSNGGLYGEGSLSSTNVFTPRASLTNQNEISIPASAFTDGSNPTTPFAFNVDFSKLTGLGATTDVTVTSQDGYKRGILQDFNVGKDGTVTGVFSNGLTKVLGQIATATFSNMGGLARYGNTMFVETPASGAAQIGIPSTGGRGTIAGSSLEGSNVDLGTEFSNMIVTQRGYQANARTITAADTMLQEAVNLIR